MSKINSWSSQIAPKCTPKITKMVSWRTQKTLWAAIQNAVLNNGRLDQIPESSFGRIWSPKKGLKADRKQGKKKTLPAHRNITQKRVQLGSEISHKNSHKEKGWRYPYYLWYLKDAPNEMLIFQRRGTPKMIVKTVKKLQKKRHAKKTPNPPNLHTKWAKKRSPKSLKTLKKTRQKTITKKDANLKSSRKKTTPVGGSGKGVRGKGKPFPSGLKVHKNSETQKLEPIK